MSSPVVEEEVIPPSYQFRALSRKNASLQIVVPLVLVCLAGILQIYFNSFIAKEFEAGAPVYTTPRLMTFNNQGGGNYTRNWQYYDLWHSENEWTRDIGNLTESGEGNQGMLGQITQFQNTSYDPMRGNETELTPWYYFYSTGPQDMINELYNRKSYWVERQLAEGEYPQCITCPQAANIFNTVQFGETPSDPSTLDYQIMLDTQLGSYQFDLEHTMMNLVDTAFLRFATGQEWTIVTWAQPFPYIQQLPTFDIGSFLGLLLYPFAVSFVLAIYVNAIVREKQDRLREMMRMMGLKMRWYWFVNYLWNIFLYAFIVGMMVITSVCFGLRMFTQTSFVIWLVILVGWGNAQVAMGFLLSTFFNKARTATIVAYILVIAGVVLSYVLNATVFKDNSDNPLVYTIFFLYAPFACYRAIYLIGMGCTLLECPRLDDIQVGGQMFWIMIFLYVDAILYFLAALYLDAVIPREFGVTKHPLFPIKALIRYIKRKQAPPQSEEESQRLTYGTDDESSAADSFLDDAEEDDDVAEEAQLIRDSRIPSSSPIVIVNLHKTYKAKPGTPTKIAVKRLNFHVEKGECFGLLGPNGAGKTTTISILTGLFPPTTGDALIGGYSICHDMDKIHRIMSVCPQFDTLWMKLTCRETLLFYARLKGIPSKEEKTHVTSILEKVGLGQYENRRAQDLSGGMRRRLSIGVSLVGDPKVVFLDEPTTGLDPETRRHLWDVLLEVKKGRCIILTTHSMEEADILCSRIGIMTRGRFMCLGTQLHLKNKFGEGYTLHVNFTVAQEQSVLRFIAEILPSARLMENFAGNLIYQMKKTDLTVSELFEKMETNKARVGIQDWGVSQTT